MKSNFEQCCKCGCGDVIGPRYKRDAYCQERLEYRCYQCGFTWSTPTIDKKDPPPVVRGAIDGH